MPERRSQASDSRESIFPHAICANNRFLPSLREPITIVDAQFAVWNRPNTVLKQLCSI